MNGRANRRRGHDCERAVAAWLRVNGWPDAKTTRSELGSDGTAQPGDVIIPGLPLVVSVKDVAASAWPSWIRQVKAESRNSGSWIVVRRLRGQPDIAGWPAATGVAGHAFELRTTFGEAIALLETVA